MDHVKLPRLDMPVARWFGKAIVCLASRASEMFAATWIRWGFGVDDDRYVEYDDEELYR